MGWYMVRSGLDHKLTEERKWATVSAYRLASHLFLAFLIYSFMLRMGFGLKLPVCERFSGFERVQLWSRLSCGVMFVTAMSGAFVAGLDAGLLYNDGFPLMAGGIIPPLDHLFALDPMWRNFFENHSMVQTCHRLLAGLTFLLVMQLNRVSSSRRGVVVPRRVFRTLHAVNLALLLQVGLGVWTVVSQVDIPVAASHQLGALVLLTTLIRLCAVLGSRGVVLA
ncbi:cytochrome c oxidase assembly protein subunit 15 [Strigomonas culicis]|uniref:Cytochrome c oxidase assembly protein subunit 15 n=1 Tax=Strigomonas culicis TaxID=28005 RepID=S9V6U9_9TRYP|nr:cytochrome c oxidase assembly protein subunit 15 [Strigomonas culicis]EPY27206.1 cytochrome c oxidase assembly protein subunit 15 [Strigomonas culicis]|eukprot:EPY22681.1 cytochrome c oxidase assembly protein subunit 15 [Strigomonas culicis]